MSYTKIRNTHQRASARDTEAKHHLRNAIKARIAEGQEYLACASLHVSGYGNAAPRNLDRAAICITAARDICNLLTGPGGPPELYAKSDPHRERARA